MYVIVYEQFSQLIVLLKVRSNVNAPLSQPCKPFNNHMWSQYSDHVFHCFSYYDLFVESNVFHAIMFYGK